MRITVESCFNGSTFYFRMTTPGGRRARVPGPDWTRTVASTARDLAALAFGVDRRNIRFAHH